MTIIIYNDSMYKRLAFRVHIIRQAWRKRRRLLFPSPAEVELIRIMGGKYITLSWVKDPIGTSLGQHFPLTFVWDLGILKREGIVRELRVGAMYIDFATVGLIYNKGIEVDGQSYHMDIVEEQDRDDYLYSRGWSVLHIRADEIYRQPAKTQQRILSFLAR